MQQSPCKSTDECFRCHQLGHWANNCPQSTNFRSPNTKNRSPISPLPPSSSGYPETHCPCGAGFCEVRVSNSDNNPNRKYYNCPGKSEFRCDHFKWCDMLKPEEILVIQPKKYPICGCEAGVCKVEVEQSGSNIGRRCFVCHIKKGYGACNFRQLVDDVPETLLGEDQELDCLTPEAIEILDAAVMGAREYSSEKDHVQMENEVDRFGACNYRQLVDDVPEALLGEDQELDCLTPEAIEILDAAVMSAREYSSEKDRVHMKTGVDGSSDIAHGISFISPGLHPRSFAKNNSENTFLSELIAGNDELFRTMNDSWVDNVEASINTAVATHENSTSQAGFNPVNLREENFPPEEGSLNLDEQLPKQPLLKDDVLDAVGKLSLCLQKDLITLSDSVGPRNHTFAPLNYLQVDYGLFHRQMMEYVNQATAHACIEQAVKDDATSREVVQRYKNEKANFEKTLHSFCEAVKAYMASNDRLITLREKISCVENKPVELEEEEFCREMENASRKENLIEITKSMSECKARMQAAYQEAEDALKLLKRE